MQKERGLVIDSRGGKVTVVTRDGRFRVLNSREDIMVGEEILIPRFTRAKGFVWVIQRRIVPALAVASILLFVSFFGYNQYLEARPVMAYVSLDLSDSPGSIELVVNDKGLVKSAVGFDESGAKALSGISYRMKPVEEVVKEFIKQQGETVLSGLIVGIVPVAEDSKIDALEKNLTEKAAKALAEHAEGIKSAGPSGGPGALSGGSSQPADATGGGSNGKPGVSGSSTDKAVVKALRIDQETRKIAQELRISPTRALLWALARSTSIQKGSSEPEDKPGVVVPGTGVPGDGQAGGNGKEPNPKPPSPEPKDTEPKPTDPKEPESKGLGPKGAGARTDGKGRPVPLPREDQDEKGAGGSGKDSSKGGTGRDKDTSGGNDKGTSGDKKGTGASISPEPGFQGESTGGTQGGTELGLSSIRSSLPEVDLDELLKGMAGKDQKTLKESTKNFVEELLRSLKEDK